MPPAGWPLRGLFPQARLQARIKIRRWLWSLPLIEQRHRLAKLFEFGAALATSLNMFFQLRRGGGQTRSQVRHQFLNFIALHDASPTQVSNFKQIPGVDSVKFRKPGTTKTSSPTRSTS